MGLFPCHAHGIEQGWESEEGKRPSVDDATEAIVRANVETNLLRHGLPTCLPASLSACLYLPVYEYLCDCLPVCLSVQVHLSVRLYVSVVSFRLCPSSRPAVCHSVFFVSLVWLSTVVLPLLLFISRLSRCPYLMLYIYVST